MVAFGLSTKVFGLLGELDLEESGAGAIVLKHSFPAALSVGPPEVGTAASRSINGRVAVDLSVASSVVVTVLAEVLSVVLGVGGDAGSDTGDVSFHVLAAVSRPVERQFRHRCDGV